MAIFLKPKMKQEERNCCLNIENYFTLETWASVVAVLNCILTFGFCLVTAGFAIWILKDTASLVEEGYNTTEHKSGGYYNRYVFNMLLLSGALLLIFILALSSFAFSIVLAKGVFKRNAEYVKIYFWYGVVVIALSAAGGLALSVLLLSPFHFDHGFFSTAVFAVFTSIALYSPFLFVIYVVAKKFERERNTAASVVYVHQLVTDADKC